MAKAEDKLDKLTELVNSLASELNANVRSIKEDIAGIHDKLNTIESNVDTKLSDFRKAVETDISDLKKDVRTEIDTKVDEGVSGLREEVVELRQELAKAEKTIRRLTDKADSPFPPDTSVVIYGLQNNEGENEEETVSWLFKEVLKVDVTIDDIERTKPRDSGKLGVIKVELSSVEEKINVLRNKLKCNDLVDSEKVIIKSCESHDARVNRINNKLLLSLLPKGQEYTIPGHGLIRKKDATKARNGDTGGNGRAVAGSEEAADEEATPPQMSDNGKPRERSGSKQDEMSRVEPSKHDNNRAKPESQSANGKKSDTTKKDVDKQKTRGGAGQDAVPLKRSARLQSNK